MEQNHCHGNGWDASDAKLIFLSDPLTTRSRPQPLASLPGMPGHFASDSAVWSTGNRKRGKLRYLTTLTYLTKRAKHASGNGEPCGVAGGGMGMTEQLEAQEKEAGAAWGQRGRSLGGRGKLAIAFPRPFRSGQLGVEHRGIHPWSQRSDPRAVGPQPFSPLPMPIDRLAGTRPDTLAAG